MKHIWHAFLTECKRMRWALLLYGLLLVALGVSVWMHCDHGSRGATLDSYGLPLPLAAWMTLAVLLRDSISSPLAFWRTLPWKRAALGAGKALFILVAIVIPASLIFTIEPLWFRVSILEVSAEWIGAVIQISGALWIVWFATTLSQRGLKALAIIGAIVCLFVFAIPIWFMKLYSLGDFGLTGMQTIFLLGSTYMLEEVHAGMPSKLIALSAATLTLIAIQYLFRKRRWSIALGLVSLFAINWTWTSPIRPYGHLEKSEHLIASEPRLVPTSATLGEPRRGPLQIVCDLAGPLTCRLSGSPTIQATVGNQILQIDWISVSLGKLSPAFAVQEHLGGSLTHPISPDVSLHMNLSSEIPRGSNEVTIDGHIDFRVVDLKPLVTIPIRDARRFREDGYGCIIKDISSLIPSNNAPSELEEEESTEHLGPFVVIAEVGWTNEDSITDAIQVRVCHRPWMNYLNHKRDKSPRAITVVVWDPIAKETVDVSGGGGSRGYEFDLSSNIPSDVLERAEVVIFTHENPRIEREQIVPTTLSLRKLATP